MVSASFTRMINLYTSGISQMAKLMEMELSSLLMAPIIRASFRTIKLKIKMVASSQPNFSTREASETTPFMEKVKKKGSITLSEVSTLMARKFTAA